MNKAESTCMSNYPLLLLCEIGANGSILYISDVLCNLLAEQPLANVTGQPLYAYLHPDDVGNVKATVDISIANRLNTIAFKARSRHNPSVVVQFSGTIKNDTCYLVGQNISEKYLDERIKEQVDKLARLATGISLIGHWYLDIEKEKLVWSDEVYAIYGVSKTEYHPQLQTAMQFYHGDDIANVRKWVRRSLDTGKQWQRRLRIVRPDGEIRDVIIASNAIVDTHGSDHIIFGIIQDVTEEVQTRNEIDELNNSLEDIIAKRTEKLREANKKLKRISVEDPLTGALSRRTFYQSYNTETKRAGRSGQPLSMALMDLDHFKNINDHYGHLVGDKVLKSVVAVIKDNMRDTDYLFRMGGEEFLLLMSNTGMVQANIVCERIRKSIAANKVSHENKRISVTLSIGLLSHYGNIDVTEALKIADESMYRAKQIGRNKVVYQTV